jgi:hypothetical protein
MSLTLRSDGNYIFYPNPQYINNTNGANYTVNLNVGCYTTGFATAPFITCTVANGWIGIDTITTITAQSGANSGYSNGSRIILDGSYATNSSKGNYGNTINFQSQNSTGWQTNMTISNGNVGINNSSPNCHLSVNGIANIHNGSPYAVSNSRMQSGSLTIGVTYEVGDNSPGWDFTNVGAPNNIPGTKFIATGTTPNSWGINEGDPGLTILIYNTGAPVATVLENTIGNVWFTYSGYVGYYYMKSDSLFVQNKTTIFNSGFPMDDHTISMGMFFDSENQITISSYSDFVANDGNFYSPITIEIRVYN